VDSVDSVELFLMMKVTGDISEKKRLNELKVINRFIDLR
jgi:hypothetical protein